jgi:hypothetical protein
MRPALTVPLVGAAVLTAGALLTHAVRKSGPEKQPGAARRMPAVPGLPFAGTTQDSLPERLRARGL